MVQLLAKLVVVYQTHAYYNLDCGKSSERANTGVNVAQQHHVEISNVQKQTYIMETLASLEQHFQQLNADLISSSRINDRYLFDQQLQSMQSLTVVGSVMIAGLTTVITQGTIVEGTDKTFLIFYSLTLSFSVGLLMLSTIISTELSIIISKFVQTRAKMYSKAIKEAREATEKVKKWIQNLNRDPEKPSPRHNQIPENRVHIANLEASQIKDIFNKHDTKIRKFMRTRENIILANQIIDTENGESFNIGNMSEKREGYHDMKVQGMSFGEFWGVYCNFWFVLASRCLYLGLLFLVMSLLLFMWMQFDQLYNNRVGAVISTLVIGITVITFSGLYAKFQYTK
eukprot:gene5927-8174_t